MTRIKVEIDGELVERTMRTYGLPGKREAVEFALRELVGEPMSREEMLAAEGMGWDGDLSAMRARQGSEP